MKTILTKAVLCVASVMALVLNVSAAGWNNLSNYTKVNDIAIRNNEVWVAATGGVMMYDKNTGEKTFFTKGQNQLPSLAVERIAINALTNDIWIGTYDNGIAKFNNGTWLSYPYPDKGAMLYEMKIAANGTIWCATTHGLYKFVNGVYTTYLATTQQSVAAMWDIDLFPNGTILCASSEPYIYNPATNQITNIQSSVFSYSHGSVYVENDSVYYFGSDHGSMAKFKNLMQTDTIEFEPTPLDSIFLSVSIQNIIGGLNHTPIVVTNEQVLYTENNGLWQPYNVGVSNANTITADNNGNFWIGSGPTDLATLTLNNGQNQNTSIDLRKTTLQSNWVRKIRKAADGNLLVIHDAGIQKYDLLTHAFTTQWNIDNDPNINDVVELNGKLYAATSYKYLYVYENNQWTQLGANDLPSNSVYYMDADALGNLWLTGSGYIAKYNGIQFTVYTNQNGPAYLNNLYARDIHCDNTRNTVWVATYAGIIEYSNGQFTQHTDSNTTGIQQYYDAANTISEDAQHNIYFGTIYGAMLKYDGTTWTTNILPEHVGNQSVTDIAFIGNAVYVSDNLHGIYIYENNAWDSLNTHNSALSDDFVTSMCVDANNNLWIGNLQYGIDVYNKTSAPLGMVETGSRGEVKIFPNPSTGKFVLQTENYYNASLNIYSIAGRLVQQTKITTATSAIDLSEQTPGIYLANIISATGTQTIKLVVSQ